MAGISKFVQQLGGSKRFGIILFACCMILMVIGVLTVRRYVDVPMDFIVNGTVNINRTRFYNSSV